MRDYYVVIVVVGGIIYTSGELLLADAEQAVQSFLLAAPNCNPQAHYRATH